MSADNGKSSPEAKARNHYCEQILAKLARHHKATIDGDNQKVILTAEELKTLTKAAHCFRCFKELAVLPNLIDS